MGVAILRHHFRQSANQFFKKYFLNVPPSETETSLVEIRIPRMSFLMGADRPRAQTNVHVHSERERERENDGPFREVQLQKERKREREQQTEME